VGSLFFEGTIIAENHQNLLNKFISLLEQNKQVSWFQQDWVTAHIANKNTFL
jgi:hypothetical protein